MMKRWRHLLRILILAILFLNLSNLIAEAVYDYPIIINYSPLAGEQGAGIDTNISPITITFNRSMNTSTINTNTIILKDSNNNTINIQTTYDSANNKVIIKLNPVTSKLQPNQVYRVVIKGGPTGVKDSNNNGLPADFVWSFGTGTSDYFLPHRNYSSNTAKCGLCHQVHQGKEYRLVRNDTTVALCFTCHDGSASKYNIKLSFDNNPGSYHPIMGLSLNGNSNKLRCTNCHNPHNVTNFRPPAPAASGALAFSRGVSPSNRAAWTAISEGDWFYKLNVTNQFELCYRCHSTWDVGNSTHANTRDIAKEFNPNNKSFHSVEADSPNSKGIFMSPFSATTRVYCTDCHSSASPGAARGPHGSPNPKILKGTYNTETGTGYSNHLCFSCHDYSAYAQRDSFRDSNQTGFYNSDRKNLHAHHSDKLGNIRCQYCHSAVVHGLNSNKHLIIDTTLENPPYESSIAKITRYVENSGNYNENNCSVNGQPCSKKHQSQ